MVVWKTEIWQFWSAVPVVMVTILKRSPGCNGCVKNWNLIILKRSPGCNGCVKNWNLTILKRSPGCNCVKNWNLIILKRSPGCNDCVKNWLTGIDRTSSRRFQNSQKWFNFEQIFVASVFSQTPLHPGPDIYHYSEKVVHGILPPYAPRVYQTLASNKHSKILAKTCFSPPINLWSLIIFLECEFRTGRVEFRYQIPISPFRSLFLIKSLCAILFCWGSCTSWR